MSKTKNAGCLLLITSSFACWQVSFAADSASQSLGDAVGATDYFKVSCANNDNGDTDHLNFRVIDNSISDINDIPPQMINAHVIKDGIEVKALTASSGASEGATINSGNGKYKILLDTVGTNTVLKTPQSYTLVYQCRNSDGVATKSSGFKTGQVKKIKNSKTAKFTLNCASNLNVSPSETTSLYLQLINQSSLPIQQWVRYLPVLNAQVTKDKMTLNTSDLAGDSSYSNDINLKGGNGDYFVSVNNTAVNNSLNNAKDYLFQYNCMSSANLETDTGVLEILQNQ